MKINSFSVLIEIVLISFVNILSIDGSPDSLKLLQIVQRHGDRNPTNFYAKDKYKDPIYWPEGIGELTKVGKTRMFEFGLTIREKYGNYLGDSPRNVSVRSSGLSRTLESAQCFMAGLYQPKGLWIWNNKTESESGSVARIWQPIAVNTVLAADDGLLRTAANCPKADRLWTEFMQTKEVTEYLRQNEDFIKYLSKQTGDEYWTQKPSPLRPLEFLSTTLRVEGKENGLQWPNWVTPEILDKLRDLEIHAFYFDWKSPQIQRLRAGLLLRELAQNMLNRADEIINKTTNNVKSLYVYETHDVNQVVLMQALNVYESESVNRTPPTYTASLVFELHQKDQDFIVKLLYFKDIKLYNTSVDDFVELKLVDCDPSRECSLEKFIKSVDNLIPLNWELECQRSSSQYFAPSYTYFNLFSFVYILCGFVLTLLSLSFIRCVSRRRKFDQMEERNALDVNYSQKYNQ